MYKKLTYEELLSLKTSFFDTLVWIIKKNKYLSFKDYLKDIHKQWSVVYHMMRQECIWRTEFLDGWDHIICYDEREKIEFHLDRGLITKIQNLILDPSKLKKQRIKAQSIEEILEQAFADGQLVSLQGKDYMVYDIETSYATNDIKTLEFYVWYAYVVQDGVGTYRYIDQSAIHKFVEYMLNFDGYIIGYNSLSFDNPVSVYNGLRIQDKHTDESLYMKQLSLLDMKSIDLFQFIRQITGKRIGLNKVSRSFVWIGKTLESGKEAEELWKIHQSGDTKALSTLKKYCKNDVKMTVLVLWYIMYYQKMTIDGEEIVYTLDEFMQYASSKDEKSLSEKPQSDWNLLF